MSARPDRRVARAALVLALVGVAAAGTAWAVDPKVWENAHSTFPQRRAESCLGLARDGSKEAAKILVKLLTEDSAPAVRDAAVAACGSLGDDDGVEILIQSRTRGRDRVARANIAAALSRSVPARAAEGLSQIAAGDSDVWVRTEAVEGIRAFAATPAALLACTAAMKHSDLRMRGAAAFAAGRIPGAEGRALLIDAWLGKDAGVRAAALEAMSAEDQRTFLIDAAEDADWRLRIEAVTIADREATRDAMDHLVRLTGDSTVRVSCSAAHVLRALTGKDFGADPEIWKGWWSANRATWKTPARRADGSVVLADADVKATRAKFMGLPLDSDRVAFVLDASGSMDTPHADGKTRAEFVRAEAIRTIAQLPDTAKVNVFLFATDVKACFPAARPLSATTRSALVEFVGRLEPDLMTNVYGALSQALEDPAIDTIVLLTDGEPSVGDFISTERIREVIRRENRTRRIAIHTVEFNSGPAAGGIEGLLPGLSRDSGGRSTRNSGN